MRTRPEEEEENDLPLPDPLLQPGSFIHPDNDDTNPPTTTNTTPTKKNNKKKKKKIKTDTTPTPIENNTTPIVPETPSWLPEGWKMESKIRTSGATAGTIDRYYFEPDSNKRFRSKKEVEFYLETGTTKKKSDYSADVNSSEIPASSKKKSASATKRKKHGAAADVQLSESPAGIKKKSGLGSKKATPTSLPHQKFDFDDVPEVVTWKLTDASNDHWTPFVEDEMVPKSVVEEWDAARQSLISDAHM